MVSVSGVILAAGAGTRFSDAEPKVWARLAGRPLLWHVIDAFARSGDVDEFVVVVRAGDEHRLGGLPEVSVPLHAVRGGERRADSARAGLSRARGDYVLIHDGARPLVSPDLIQRVLEATRHHGAAVPVVPAADTARYAANGWLRGEAIARAGLVLIQTPQGFRRDILSRAYGAAEDQGIDFPDDAAAVLALGHAVAAVPGDPANLKITRPEDLTLGERLLAAGS